MARFRLPRRRGFPAFLGSFFFRSLSLRRRRPRPFSRRHHARHRQAQAAAALEHSMELPGPSRKRARQCSSSDGGRSSAGGAPDLLSDLPDCLLHTIMSYMKARQVVQTCVLSKRWRHLWRSVPCLNIDVAELRTKTAAATTPGCCYNDKALNWDLDEFIAKAESPGCSCDKAMSWKRWEKFVDFAVNLVQRCNIALLDSLRLHGHGDRTPLLFLRYATRSSGQMERVMSSAGAASWRRLRRLQLTHVPLDDCFATYVGLGCHPLEDLELDGCTFEIRRIFFDSLKHVYLKHCRLGNLSEITASPTLKTLVIFCGLNDPLVIFAPAVTYLHVSVTLHGSAAGISIKEMPSLDKTMIQLYSSRYYVPNTELSRDRFKFLHSVSNVTSLALCTVGGMLTDETEAKPVLRLKTTDFLRENIKFKIIYKECYTHQLNEFMMRVSGYRWENYIKLLIPVDLKCTL